MSVEVTAKCDGCNLQLGVDPIFCEECLDAIVKRHKDELDNATKELATAKRTIAKLYTELVRKEREKNER